MTVVISLAMTSCDKVDEVLHGNMLDGTSWIQNRNIEYVGEDGYRHSATTTLTLKFTSPTKGELNTVLNKGSETEENSYSFKYSFIDNMISGTISISDGEYAGKYNMAYSDCDNTLIIYSESGTLSGAFVRKIDIREIDIREN
ncbi:MAG: hypothetical protein K6E86_00980 [Bacteroidales bacterium]|nr:hypothetical protein [Bacteroidales bacterium]